MFQLILIFCLLLSKKKDKNYIIETQEMWFKINF
jgi:hypothetical protein